MQDVLLVRKSYEEKRRKRGRNARAWKLKRLDMEVAEERCVLGTAVGRSRGMAGPGGERGRGAAGEGLCVHRAEARQARRLPPAVPADLAPS